MNAGTIGISLIETDPNNPRTTIDEAGLVELARSMEAAGLLQPITVRHTGATDGYQIICGHRRFAAARYLGWLEIPAIVMDVTGEAAAEMALIENLQRADLSPVEEAHGYGRLSSEGRTPQQIADAIGRPVSHVVKRLQLLELPQAGISAVETGAISLAVAYEIARLPGLAQREEALAMVVAGAATRSDWRTGEEWVEPMTAREARRKIFERFMTHLDRAPFDVNDPDLVPAAGACPGCRHRTGNQVDLFGDLQSEGAADTCTYSACYQQKTEAHAAFLLERARREGCGVIPAKKAANVFTPDGSLGYSAGFVEADAAAYNHNTGTRSKQSWRKALGKKAPQIMAAVSPKGELVYLYDKKAAQAALDEKKGKPAAAKGDPGDGALKPAKERKPTRHDIESAVSMVVRRKIMDQAADHLPELAPIAAAYMLEDQDSWTYAQVLGLEGPDEQQVAVAIAGLTWQQCLGLVLGQVMDFALEATVRRGRYGDTEDHTRSTAIQAALGIDIMADLAAALEAAGIAPAANREAQDEDEMDLDDGEE